MPTAVEQSEADGIDAEAVLPPRRTRIPRVPPHVRLKTKMTRRRPMARLRIHRNPSTMSCPVCC